MPPQVSAVVLAAGLSVRMGRSKQLLPLGPKPVILHCLDSILDAGIGDIVVVLGACSDGIAAAVSSLPVRTMINDDPASNMAASVRLGRRAIDPASTAVLICLSFHPLVSAGTVAAIASTHHVSSDSIVIPSYHGRRDHPTLFPWPVIEDIFRGTTLRQVIVAHAEKVRLAEVDDEGVFSTWTHRKTTNG